MDNSFEIYGIKPSKLNRQKRRDKRLHEEVIECGRHGGGARNKKSKEAGQRKHKQRLQRLDTFPAHESIREVRKVAPSTGLADNLEPLIRWLARQVGRPWAKVYAKLGRIARPDSMHGAHIRGHLLDYVQAKTWLDENGEVVVPGCFGAVPDPKFPLRGFRPRYFVHPVTGLLLKMPGREPAQKGPFPKKARWKKEKERTRAKIRQGIAHKRPATSGVDASAWACVRTRNKRLVAGMRLDIRMGSDVFRAEVLDAREEIRRIHRTVNNRPVWSSGPVLEVKVVVLESYACDKIGVVQYLTLLTWQDAPAEWTAFDQDRLF